ncbi:hypothetical protein LSH36_199g05026 [Paralvinella palmiformis]|uniref:Uncharacterized protein n=1 Tax=Paralvinella palmiformis TaxID=53620 RepID=A0AAD9JQ25_9ANNE|nr:hypothetical protein LSH36_199g05026 [Paralvinella palmiformis]
MSGIDLIGKYPIPRYIPPQKYKSDKGEDNIYPFNHLGFNLNDVEQRNDNVLSELTLFAPFSHEDDITPSVAHLQRPITPINEEIKQPPSTCHKLSKLVRRRIVPQPTVKHLGLEDQQELGAIIIGEVNGIWPDIRTQVKDPFLTAAENRELQRRISVHIVTVCEQLFKHYLQKAQILNRRGVFSGPANMSRLKAQLALDVNKFLNILTIKRYIVADLKCERKAELSDDDVERIAPLPPQRFPLLSYKGLIESSRPKSRSHHRRFATPQEDIMEIEKNMPDLDTSKLMSLLNDLPSEVRIASKLSSHSVHSKVKSAKQKEVKRKTSEDLSKDKVILKKSDSVPMLMHGETLFEELGLQTRTDSALSMGEISESPTPGDDTLREAEIKKQELKEEKAQPGSWEYKQEDLLRLIRRGTEDDKDTNVDEDLPPLLQALITSPHQEERRQRIEERLRDLEQKEQERLERDRIEIREPTHPQPATVSTKLPNKMVVRTSDIRVSDRICLSSITLQKYDTVYNDLIDEIDPVTVKQLDSNLFLGDEITEVYREIMKTVPKDHLDLENDEQIEVAADSLNLSSALASSTLSKKKNERVVNPQLHRDIDPPWGAQDIMNWAKTPYSPPRDVKGRALVNPMMGGIAVSDVGSTTVCNMSGKTISDVGCKAISDVGGKDVSDVGVTVISDVGVTVISDVPRGEGLAMNDFYGENYKPPEGAFVSGENVENMPEVMARSYASWLAWWKNSINSDDYMKYLSTQESDYMGAIFHFYNSEDEDDEEDDDINTSRSRTSKKLTKEQQVEKRQKIQELKALKTEFSDGFWNANSVLMGGLGQEPYVDDDDTELPDKTPSSEQQSRLGQRSRTLVISRKSQKTQISESSSCTERDQRMKSRDEGTSRASQLQSRTDTKYTTTATEERTECEPTIQSRLENIWNSLSMPDNLKLDMAIKYSSDQYHSKLEEAVEIWEQAIDLVLQREAVIAKLENFERLASDPNRFFEKGQRGSSVARLEEARMRSLYYKKIDSLEEGLLEILIHLEKEYNDVVTYQGRPYREKMHWDRTEMLYWLQEERKEQAMEYESRMRGSVAVSTVHLEPLMSAVSTPVS